MAGYSGDYTVTMDENGRLAIPVRLRSARPLGFPAKKKIGKYVLAKWVDGCLALFVAEEWARRLTALVAEGSYTREQRVFHRHLGPNSSEVVPDSQGRITIPKNLQETAKLSGEVKVIGATLHIEICNPVLYDKFLSDNMSFEASADKLFEKSG